MRGAMSQSLTDSSALLPHILAMSVHIFMSFLRLSKHEDDAVALAGSLQKATVSEATSQYARVSTCYRLSHASSLAFCGIPSSRVAEAGEMEAEQEERKKRMRPLVANSLKLWGSSVWVRNCVAILV